MENSSWQMTRYHDDEGNQLFPLDENGGLQCEWDIIEATEEMATLEDDGHEEFAFPQQMMMFPTQPERTDE